MIPRERLAVNTNQKEPLFCYDVFAIMQLEDELPLRHLLTHTSGLRDAFLLQGLAPPREDGRGNGEEMRAQAQAGATGKTMKSSWIAMGSIHSN
jgi:hypothetical protein